jgi:hypothetical protein
VGHVRHGAACARSGKITFCSGAVKMSADSAMKCTPQNTMNSASGRAAFPGQLEGIACDIGELNHLVALVVMPSTKSRSPSAAFARLARSTSAGSEAGGRSPGHSTPRSDRGSDSCPRTNSDSGVPDRSALDVGVLVTQQMYSAFVSHFHCEPAALLRYKRLSSLR